MINARQQFTVHCGNGLAAGDGLAANMKIYKQFVNNARALQSKVRGADQPQVGDDSEPTKVDDDKIETNGAADLTSQRNVGEKRKADSEEIIVISISNMFGAAICNSKVYLITYV